MQICSIRRSKNLTARDKQDLQNFVLLSVTSGLFIPPRRSLDYCAFKLRGVDHEKDNYMEKRNFVFNSLQDCKNVWSPVSANSARAAENYYQVDDCERERVSLY